MKGVSLFSILQLLGNITPKAPSTRTQTAEAAIAGVRSIADSCIRSQTVKRLIYTASIFSMSPRNNDGVGFRPLLDESCWTPLDASSTYGNEFTLVPFLSLES